jgi:hypothetical protein
MDLSTLLIILIVFIIFFSVSFFIPETKFRIAYYMILALLFLSGLNIYLSIVYYIQLRNTAGVPGTQGDKGPTGVKGAPGKCSFAETCEIKDARNTILKIANTMYNIPKDCLDNPTLATCGNSQDTLEQAMPINAQINMLEQIAFSTKMGEKDFIEKIQVCMQDSNRCMDPTDF